MDKYRRVPVEKPEAKANEVLVVSAGVNITDVDSAVEKLNTDDVFLRASGRAIPKAVRVAELVRRRVAGLHQITELSSDTVSQTFEPIVEGLENKVVTRTVSSVSIQLSKKALDKKNPGYQAPLSEDEVKAEAEREVDEEDKQPPRRSSGKPKKKKDAPKPKAKGKKGGDKKKEEKVSEKKEGEKKEGGRRRRNRGAKKDAAKDDAKDNKKATEKATEKEGEKKPSRRRGRGRGRGGRGRGAKTDDAAPAAAEKPAEKAAPKKSGRRNRKPKAKAAATEEKK